MRVPSDRRVFRRGCRGNRVQSFQGEALHPHLPRHFEQKHRRESQKDWEAFSYHPILISISTPEGRERLCKLSMVLKVVSLRSIRRRCVRISNWSRASLWTKVERFTVNLRMRVGRGIGPCTMAP